MRVISGTSRGTTLKTPDGIVTRPTTDRVKEAMFSIIQFDLPGSRILDLFGGTGQLGIEALSRGAKEAVFVDSREDACRLIRENVKRTHFENAATIVRADYEQYLKRCNRKFDIILLDPPYLEVFLENSLKIISEIDILQSSGIIVTERPAEKCILEDLPGFSASKDYKYGNTIIRLYRKD